ncbi:hypothetical protein ANN_20662 [Periplaneta americana]|uniref:Uncharacterized protein n=1 Tax=Periplaneta americana TaxID=6978 RepID=A0ABQ8SDI1_PERAM|nr:hypothetical protein ANN_20662 [Periplaneta americana]
MAGLCEGGDEPSGSLKAISDCEYVLNKAASWDNVRPSKFKVCYGSLHVVMWLADEPREFNLPTSPQRRITYMQEKLPTKYGVHSEEYLPIRTVNRPIVIAYKKYVCNANRFVQNFIFRYSVRPTFHIKTAMTDRKAFEYPEFAALVRYSRAVLISGSKSHDSFWSADTLLHW